MTLLAEQMAGGAEAPAAVTEGAGAEAPAKGSKGKGTQQREGSTSNGKGKRGGGQRSEVRGQAETPRNLTVTGLAAQLRENRANPGDGEGEGARTAKNGKGKATAAGAVVEAGESTTPAGNESVRGQAVPDPILEEAEAEVDGAAPEGAELDTEARAAEPKWRQQLAPEIREALDELGLENGQQKLIARIHRLVDERDAERQGRLELLRKGNGIGNGKVTDEVTDEGMGNQARGVFANGDDPVSYHPEMQRLEGEIAQLEGNVTWAEEHGEGGTLRNRETGEPVELDEAGVRKQRRSWERRLNELYSERAVTRGQLQTRFEAKRQETQKTVGTLYPWMDDAKTAEYQEALAVLNEMPGVTLRPDWELIVGDLVVARLSRKGKAGALRNGVGNGSGKVTDKVTDKVRPRREPTPMPAGASAQPPGGGDALDMELAEAQEEFRKTGTQRSYQKVLRLERELKLTRRG